MSVTIELPPKLEEQLSAALGGDLPRAVKEALAIEAYRTDKLSIGQVADLLDLSTDGANDFLKARGVFPKYAPADLDKDVASLESLLGKPASPK